MIGNESPEDGEVVSLADAAAECGMSEAGLVALMVRDGLLIEHPNGGYVPSPHPDLVELSE